MRIVDGVEVKAPVSDRFDRVLTPAALDFVAGLHRRFNTRREELLRLRAERQVRFDAGQLPDFLPETAEIRQAVWHVAPVPADLQDRRVEITGPVDRKMVINALNSGAKVFMADFEDAHSPTWQNCIEGQLNLIDAVDGNLVHTGPGGRVYFLNDRIATLMVRPRGWHLTEKHVKVDGQPVSASLFDFGLYFYHNALRLVARGSGPYFYLPKLESHLEARLWNDLFGYAQDALGLPQGTVKATVLIETITAAFEMDEILYELREHSAGLNAGRWDYIFSVIKQLGRHPEFVLPDRSLVTMASPFMRAYAQLLVKTCHRRRAHAIGGMAAFIPSRRDAAVNARALERVQEDKLREAADGFDGTWVAHPDLVPVARAVFDEALGGLPNQVHRQRDDVAVTAADLLNIAATEGEVTEPGLRENISVAIRYLESWLHGTGAVAIHHLMEDAATAEIARAQVWQWLRHRSRLAGGPVVTPGLVRELIDEEMEKIHREVGPLAFTCGRYHGARTLFEQVALQPELPDFLTLPAYDLI